ncbi:unnamed protein product, partial [Mesorhabditis spiculigera]
MCAELTGTFLDGRSFFYHCQGPGYAYELLTKLYLESSTKIQKLAIRLDPDPLRECRQRWIFRRLKRWKALGRRLQVLDLTVLLDSNMPLW